MHSTILDFQNRVRARLMNLYADLECGRRPLTRKVARVLFMTLEHDAFHTEVSIRVSLCRMSLLTWANFRRFCICLYNVPGPAQFHRL